jgi:hypothetical protein
MNKQFTILLALCMLVLAPIALSAESFDALLPLLVDLPGWQAEKPDGVDLSESGQRAISATRSYTNGERTFEATILIGMQVSTVWMPNYKEGLKVETPDGLMEVKKINGFLVFDVFAQEGGSGGIGVLLQDSQSKSGLQAVFALSYEGLSREEAMKNAQLFSWQKMKDQAAKLK